MSDIICHHEKHSLRLAQKKNHVITYKDENSGMIKEKTVYVKTKGDLIPPILKELYPNIELETYYSMKKDQSFLDKEIFACSDCAFDILDSLGPIGGAKQKIVREAKHEVENFHKKEINGIQTKSPLDIKKSFIQKCRKKIKNMENNENNTDR